MKMNKEHRNTTKRKKNGFQLVRNYRKKALKSLCGMNISDTDHTTDFFRLTGWAMCIKVSFHHS